MRVYVQRGEMREGCVSVCGAWGYEGIGCVSVCGVWGDEGRMCECLWSAGRRG